MFSPKVIRLISALINLGLLVHSAQANLSSSPSETKVEHLEHSDHDHEQQHHAEPEVTPHDTKVVKKADASYLVSDTLPFETHILKWLQETFVKDPRRKHVPSMLDEQGSYDFNVRLSTCDLLRRIGFEANTFESTSFDGYVTQLVQIVNPKQKQRHQEQKIHRPTVVFYAGQGTSPAAFLAASFEKHHPAAFKSKQIGGELYFEGPHFYNRSLALTLANLGFDVWLVPARGVDKENRRRCRPEEIKNDLTGANPFAQLYGEVKRHDYWSFTSDDIIKYELKQQLDLVRQHANCDKFSLISYSNGAFVSFGFISQEPHYAERHIEQHIAIGPAVFVNKFNVVLGGAHALTYLSPPGLPFLEEHLDAVARGSFIQLCRSKLVRYSLCKVFLNNFYGHSDLFETFLELEWFNHIGRPASTKHLRQSLQTAYSGRMRRYDYGCIGNLFIYGQLEPKEYNLAECKLLKTYLVSGEKDAIVDQHAIERLASELGERPKECLRVEGYNHLDLLFGWDVAEKVNKPILAILKEKQMEANYFQDGEGEHKDGDHHGEHHEAANQRDDHQDEAQDSEYSNEDSRGINAKLPVQPPTSLTADRTESPTTTANEKSDQQQQPLAKLRIDSTARQISHPSKQQQQSQQTTKASDVQQQQQAKSATTATTSGRQQTRDPRANDD